MPEGDWLYGGVKEVRASDDDWLIVRKSSILAPSVVVEFEARSPYEPLGSMSVSVETSSNAPPRGALYSLMLYNYRWGTWVTIGSWRVRFRDETRQSTAPADPTDYVEPITRTMRARLLWDDGGFSPAQWLAAVDRASFGCCVARTDRARVAAQNPHLCLKIRFRPAERFTGMLRPGVFNYV